MRIAPRRLRRGEILAGASGVALLAFMFLLTWYEIRTPLGWTAATLGVRTTFTGWDALSHLRWLMLATPLAAIALAYFQASRRAPAIPVALSMIVTVLALVTVIVLAYRVLVNAPGSGDLRRQAGAYLGLLAAVGILVGAFDSLRSEGIDPRDGPGEIETVSLAGARTA